ncbi:hypothetical protein BKA70DRAFT_1575731 [Coprinopsis sp. MPI-PUGE-AT-0042]|nr:hypothetical protein BKA70DRAFT_1575731 [Coprinopsis sp. MPI-PUGE-AT-0042]
MASPGLLTVPPETFGHVADHLPLYAHAPTLRSLALSNRYLFDPVHPLLYRHLNLTFTRDVHRSLEVLLRLRDPGVGLGNEVRALYLTTDRPPMQSADGGRAMTSMTLLKDFISKGKLPFLKRLELFNRGDVGPEVSVSNAGEIKEITAEPWDLNLSSLNLNYSIRKGFSPADRRIDPFLELTFPPLKVLSFHDFSFQKSRGTGLAIQMQFWKRHRLLESLSLSCHGPDNREAREDAMLSQGAPPLSQLLPNLKELFVTPSDLEPFLTLLQQLEFLNVFHIGYTDRPWFSPDTPSLKFPLLKSFTVTELSGRQEDIAYIANASPELEELIWYGVSLRGKTLERLFFDYPRIAPDEDYSPNSAMGHATLTLAKWFPSLNVMGNCVPIAYRGRFHYARIDRDSQGTVTHLEPIRSPRKWSALGREDSPTG